MLNVFLLAVVAAFDAGLLAAVVVLLSRPNPDRQLLMYWLGAIGLSIAFGLVIVLGLKGSGLTKKLGVSVSPGVEVAVGAVLIAIAAIVGSGRWDTWRARRHERSREAGRSHRPTVSERALRHDSVWIAWAAGAAYSVPGASYLAGLALLVKLDSGTVADVVAIVVFNVVMFTLVEVPLIGFLLAPDRTRQLAERLSRWMTRRRRVIVAVVAGAVGVYLLVSGLSSLG